jgi:hypothetical protein
MKRLPHLSIFFLLAVTLSLTGCSKSSGPVGPAGAQGSTGAAGVQGSPGPEGNANVQVKTLSVTNAQWLWNANYEFQTSPGSYTEYFTRYYDAAFSEVTQGILDSGMVLVYFIPNTIDNDNQWAPLPYQFTDESGYFNYEMAFETMPGKVRLHFFFVPLNASATIPTLSTYDIVTYKFKMITLSGSVVTSMNKAHVNWNNYAAVSNFISTAGLPYRMPENKFMHLH